MAALSSSGPALCPSFAVVCSFLERYGAALDLPEMSFPQMEKYLRDTSTVPKPLVELHVKLLRKLGKSVSTDRWEKYLAKVCQELNNTWAWELKQRGYKDMTMECKSSILKYLCECQFDENLKFKTALNEEEPETMRLQPIGRDRRGLTYWFQLDHEQNIRLYTEEQDDLDGSSWRCIVRSRSDLVDALELLKGQMKPGSRDSSPTLDQDNGNTEKLSESERTVSIKEEPIKQEVQQECSQSEEKDKFKPPGAAEGSVPYFDNRVSTITTVKAESRDPHKNHVSVLIATGMAKQEVQQATMRSNQQAKIPLKKRELKLSESYLSNHLSNHSSSSIIVCNPSVIQTTDRPELTNGRAPLVLPLKSGQNGVTGATVGHVGVIRSPLECNRLQQPNQHLVQREDSRQSVLVQKEETYSDKTTIQSPVVSLKPHDVSEVVEKDVDLTNEAEKAQVKETVKEDTVESISSTCNLKDDAKNNVSTSSSDKVGEATPSPQEQGSDKAVVNGADVKDTRAPVEEASSELQKEGIRLKIKIPPHRRDKLRARSAKEQCKERGASERPLRRSARICRPSSKVAESQRKKVGRRKRPFPVPEQAEREEEDRRGAGTRKPRGKRRPGRPRWTSMRSKRPRLHQDVQEEDSTQPHRESRPGINCEGSTRGDACTHCGLPNHPELILLCDLCDCGYHTACLRPPLMLIPDGEWFCPTCQHNQLCEKLEEQLLELDSALRRRERAEKRRERLVYVGISVENIIPEGDVGEEKCVKKKDSKRSKNVWRRSTRARKLISYRFDDFDDAIEEAIEDDKDLSGRQYKALSAVSDGKGQWPIKGHDRKRRRRRLNDLESDSTAVDSEDEFLLSHSSGEEEVCASVADDEDEADSEVCSWDSISRGAPRGRPKGRTKGRPRGRPRGRRPQEEESDQNTDSEAYSVMSDSDDDKTRKGLRRGQRQQVNYCETSDSSDITEAAAQKVRRKRQERLSTDYSDVSALSTESEEDCGEEEDTGRRRAAKDFSKTRVRQRHRQRERPQRSRHSHTDSDTSQSSEQERPLRKRLNRIASDEEESDPGVRRRTRAPTGPQRKHRGPSQEQDSGPNSPQS